MNSLHDIDKAYVSPYDRFLYEYDATHEKTAAQRQEIAKHQRIAALRDGKPEQAPAPKMWDGF